MMQRLWRQPGFARLNAVVFLNAWVNLGHSITMQNAVFKLYDGPVQVALTGLVNILILLPYVYLMWPAGCWSATSRPTTGSMSGCWWFRQRSCCLHWPTLSCASALHASRR